MSLIVANVSAADLKASCRPKQCTGQSLSSTQTKEKKQGQPIFASKKSSPSSKPTARSWSSRMTLDDLFNSDDGAVDYPFWTIKSLDLERQHGPEFAVPQMNCPGGPSVLAIFSDDDMAQRFIDDIRLPNCEPLIIPTAADMLELVDAFRKDGVKHVGYEIWFRPPGGAIVPIDEFRDGVVAGLG